MQVTIIGGGVIGLCCAYYMQKSGCEVTIIDKGDITNGCSFGNAGYVSPSHFTPLASPGIIAKGLRWMLSSSSPFYIKPRLDIELIKWGLQFWKSANTATAKRNAPSLNNFLQLSRELTSQIKNDLGNSFRMQEIGCFMLYKTAVTEKHEIELAEESKKYGIETIILSAAEVQSREPDLEVNVRGGVLYPIDAHLHPGEFMQTLVRHLQNAGVKFITNATVSGFEQEGRKVKKVLTNKGAVACEELVIAPGSWLSLLAKQLGIKILLQPGKGYSMTFTDVQPNLRYPAILVDDRVAMTPMGKDLRMGGTMEISGLNGKTLVNRAKSIFTASKKYYPGLGVSFPDVEKIWSGFRPLSPDGLPYIGRHSKYDNLTIAGGHAMIGLSLAAGTGKVLDEMVTKRPLSVNMEAFKVERFG